MLLHICIYIPQGLLCQRRLGQTNKALEANQEAMNTNSSDKQTDKANFASLSVIYKISLSSLFDNS